MAVLTSKAVLQERVGIEELNFLTTTSRSRHLAVPTTPFHPSTWLAGCVAKQPGANAEQRTFHCAAGLPWLRDAGHSALLRTHVARCHWGDLARCRHVDCIGGLVVP